MSVNRIIASIATVLLVLSTVGSGFGQVYPNKPIRIVTYAAGGGNDFAARLLAQSLSGPLGQPVIVDNRGGGVIPGEFVAKAMPDGYTLLVAGNIYTIGHLLEDTPYDPIRDFEPISTISTAPLLLVVHPSLPVNSVKDLIALARAKPGALNFGSSGVGGATNLTTLLFKSMAGKLHFELIDYKIAINALMGLMAGEIQVMFIAVTSGGPQLKSGRLRAVAVTSLKPSILAPGLPTVAATVPGFESTAYNLIAAPAKTPPAVIARLNQEIVRVLNQPDIKQRFLKVGVEAQSSTPEELSASTKAEIARMGKVIKEAGIKLGS